MKWLSVKERNNMTDTYKKISFKELQKFADAMKYYGDIPVEEICEKAKKYFGEKATKVIVNFDDEYNDEGYDLRGSLEVFDKEGNELGFGDDDKLADAYHDWRYGLTIGSGSYDGDRSVGPIEIDVVNKKIVDEIPELYIKE